VLLNTFEEHLWDGNGAFTADALRAHFDREFGVYISGPVEALAVLSVKKSFVAHSGHRNNAIVCHFESWISLKILLNRPGH